MKTISVALFALCAAFSAAKADEAYWPFQPSGYPEKIDIALKQTMDANFAYYQELRNRLIAQGGINADFLPFLVASHPMVHFGAFGQGKAIGSNGE